MSLTIEYTTIDMNSILARLIMTNRSHGNTSHINIVHKLSLGICIAFTGNCTVGNKLLRSKDLVITVFVLSRNKFLKNRNVKNLGLTSLLCSISTTIIYIIQIHREIFNDIYISIVYQVLAIRNPFIGNRILLNQRQVLNQDVIKKMSRINKCQISLTGLIEFLEQLAQVFYSLHLTLYALSSIGSSNSSQQRLFQLLRIARRHSLIWHSVNQVLVSVLLDNSICTGHHALQSHVDIFLSLFPLASIYNLEG